MVASVSVDTSDGPRYVPIMDEFEDSVLPTLWRLQGKTVFLPGLLAKAHRGVLYIDDINLLDTELCQILLGIVTDGWVNIEVGVGRSHGLN